MAQTTDDALLSGSAGPKRPLSYNEGVDEAPNLIESEPVEIEKSTPAGERTSVQSEPADDDFAPPLYED